ncbi:MAG: MbtH family protein [Pyrinomonadaceae bacterium]
MSLQGRDEEDRATYKVVVNDEGQYSILPDYAGNPAGWRDAGPTGPKTECLAYIKDVWTDMRPLSLRMKMEELARNPPHAEEASPPRPARGASLVARLCEGEHPFVLCLRPEPSLRRFREAIEQGYLRVNFTDTNPGTELGVRLDKDACELGGGDFEGGSGRVKVVGGLTLDYVKLRCEMEVDLATLAGSGRLEGVEAGGGAA